jgi:hypothetical protein
MAGDQAAARRRAALRKARSARGRQLARERKENARAWRAWSRWCREAAVAYGQLRAARASGEPALIQRAIARDRRMLAAMPPLPKDKR